MPISVDEREALRNLVTWARDELNNAGDPDNSLMSLQALTDQRLDQYNQTIGAERDAIYQLIDADPAAHLFWAQAQADVWVRLLQALPENEITLLAYNADDRVRRLLKSLPVLASIRWTLTNYQTGG